MLMTCQIYLMNIHSITYACNTLVNNIHTCIYIPLLDTTCAFTILVFFFLICNLLRLLMLLHIHIFSYINSYFQTVINKYITHIYTSSGCIQTFHIFLILVRFPLIYLCLHAYSQVILHSCISICFPRYMYIPIF